MAGKTSPIKFIQQVRAETAKVSWPSRRETIISTILVIIMAALVSIFLFLSDRIMEFGVWEIIGFFQHLFS